MKKIISLLLSSVVALSMSAQTYTIISRNNDTIKMIPNALGASASAIKSIIPGSKSEAPQYRLIKKTENGKESLIFVDFTKILDKILVAYETDMVTPGEWQVTTISYSDLYNAVSRKDAIYLSGEILGMKVEMFQRPPIIWEDLVCIDGVTFPLPIKLALYEKDLAQKTEKAMEKEAKKIEKEEKEELDRKILKELAAKDENKAYIAYLIKVELLDLRYKEEVEGTYNMNEVMQLVESTSDKDLLKMSKTHSEQLNKYRK